MKKIKNIINKILAAVSVLLFSALVCTVTWQVFARFILKQPNGTTEEMAKILFVWLVLVSAAYLFGERGGHMNIGILLEKAPPRLQLLLNILIQLIIAGFAGFVLINGGFSAVLNGIHQTNAAIPALTTGQIYSAIPICGAFTIFYCICFLIEDISALIHFSKEAKPQ